METTLVYRVENGHGEGMYRGGGISGQNMTDIALDFDLDATEDHHPTPVHDTILKDTLFSGVHPNDVTAFFRTTEPYSFGFKSPSSLLDWLYDDDWLKLLDENGFYIVVYESDTKSTYHGSRQTAFDKEYATAKDTMLLTDLIGERDDQAA